MFSFWFSEAGVSVLHLALPLKFNRASNERDPFSGFWFISHLPTKLQALVEAVNLARSGTTFFFSFSPCNSCASFHLSVCFSHCVFLNSEPFGTVLIYFTDWAHESLLQRSTDGVLAQREACITSGKGVSLWLINCSPQKGLRTWSFFIENWIKIWHFYNFFSL